MRLGFFELVKYGKIISNLDAFNYYLWIRWCCIYAK